MRVGKKTRPIHNLWDYNGDGLFSTERIKGRDKQYLKRWRRNLEKREALKEIGEFFDDAS